MIRLTDSLLLRRGTPDLDDDTAFRRIDGTRCGRVVYFLPWHTPFKLARALGLLPLEFLACYELPSAIVSSIPAACVASHDGMVADALRLIRAAGLRPTDVVVVGMSAGVFPAATLAAELETRVCAIAAGDRADLMLWQSPAVRAVRQRALKRGYRQDDFSAALAGRNPVDHLERLAAGSLFILGRNDPFIPATRHQALLASIRASSRPHDIIELDTGHFATIRRARRFQPLLLADRLAPRRAVEPPWWQARLLTRFRTRPNDQTDDTSCRPARPGADATISGTMSEP